MTLREYFDELQEFIETYPECLDMEVIYSRDDEGNGYQKVYYGPTKGIFEDSDFIQADLIDEYERDEDEINSVCIN